MWGIMNNRVLVLLLGLALLSTIITAQQENDLLNLAKIKSGVKSKRVSSYDTTGGNYDRFEDIKTGETRTLCNIKGSGIINHVWITIAPVPPKLSRNDIVIRMYWDGNDFPSVEAPIGPFFGQGWDENYNFTSLPLVVAPAKGKALVSYFAMPFESGARIEIENQSEVGISAFYFYIDYVEVENFDKDMGRFCAWYNHELTDALPEGENEWSTLGKTKNNTSTEDNYLFLDVEGKGHYVGVNYYINTPTTLWYGEGDDMFYIDGSKTPVLHGTGTEDYFNTSWSPYEKFDHPYFGAARVNDNIGWMGRTHVYRFHITDPVYFDKHLKFTIEHGHNNCLTLDLASVAYWYQQPPLTKMPPIPSKADREPKSEIKYKHIHQWRHEWRKSKGNDSKLWGDEK